MNRFDDLELRGDLQAEVMRAVWRLGEVTVDHVREAEPEHRRHAYNTIQTILNRLVERGLIERERRGKAFVYRATFDESQVVARSISQRLADASQDARRAAVLNLVESLGGDELDEVARLANRIRRKRQSR